MQETEVLYKNTVTLILKYRYPKSRYSLRAGQGSCIFKIGLTNTSVMSDFN